jgi:hypothetical protein
MPCGNIIAQNADAVEFSRGEFDRDVPRNTLTDDDRECLLTARKKDLLPKVYLINWEVTA